jgi:heptosyltransferase-2
VIAKKGIDQLVPFFPDIQETFVFSKEEYKGARGLWQFGKMIRRHTAFDLFFCLPNSFSSALMGYATGTGIRVGYKQELRQLLLTHSYRVPEGMHRAEEYLALIGSFTGTPMPAPDVRLRFTGAKEDYVVVNINSEASSRRLTPEKAVDIISRAQMQWNLPLVLIGAPKEKEFVDAVVRKLPSATGIENRAGATGLPDLVRLLGNARVMLSTDSGPAHLANALGTRTVVLFGAGNEFHTAPYNKNLNEVIRLGKLTCEPCRKNVCVRYGIPQCLEQLSAEDIVQAVGKNI